MQRRFAKATRKAGLEATVSARALMARAPSRADFAQLGMRPHRGRSTVRPSSRWSTTVSGSVGATFQDGWNAPVVIRADRAPPHRRCGRPPRVGSAGSSGHTCAHGGTSPLACRGRRWFGAHSQRGTDDPSLADGRSVSSSSHCSSWARSPSRSCTYLCEHHPALGGRLSAGCWPSTAGRASAILLFGRPGGRSPRSACGACGGGAGH